MEKSVTDTMIWQGRKCKLVYTDADDFDNLPYQKCTQVYGVCFYKNKIIIGKHKNHWSLIGGTIEKDESFIETLEREVMEESNTKVIKCKPPGYQEVTNPEGEISYQLRYVARVEPIAEFEKDPAGNGEEIFTLSIQMGTRKIENAPERGVIVGLTAEEQVAIAKVFGLPTEGR